MSFPRLGESARDKAAQAAADARNKRDAEMNAEWAAFGKPTPEERAAESDARFQRAVARSWGEEK